MALAKWIAASGDENECRSQCDCVCQRVKLLQDMLPQEFCFQIQLNNFLSKLVVKVCKIFHIQKDTILLSSAKSGLKDSIHLFANHILYKWPKIREIGTIFIPLVLFAHRTLISEAIGDLPFYCLYGREPRLSLMLNFYHQLQMTSLLQFSIMERTLWKWQNWLKIPVPRENIQRSQQEMKEYYDLNASRSPS